MPVVGLVQGPSSASIQLRLVDGRKYAWGLSLNGYNAGLYNMMAQIVMYTLNFRNSKLGQLPQMDLVIAQACREMLGLSERSSHAAFDPGPPNLETRLERRS